MAAGIPAARETPGESSGQQIGWDGETVEQMKLALTEARGLRAPWFFFHIVVTMLQVKYKCKSILNAKIGLSFPAASACGE